MTRAVINVLLMAFILSCGALFLDNLMSGNTFCDGHAPEGSVFALVCTAASKTP